MANISSEFDQKKIFQGPAIVYLGAYSFTTTGCTPSAIGGIMEVSMDVGLDIVQVKQGWPRMILAQFVREKTVTISFRSLEPGDYDLNRYALASATYTADTPVADEDELKFGEQNTQTECAIKLEIVNVDGYTEEIRFWRCVGGVESISRAFEDEEVHSPTYTFTVLRATHDWTANNDNAWDTDYAYYQAILDKRT